MKKLIIILLSFLSFAASAQIDQKFGAFADNLDSLYNHTGRQLQPIFVHGRFSPNDGFAAIYFYDSLSTETEIPYIIIKVAGTDTGRWIQSQLLSSGGGGDTSIFNSPDYIVLDILTVPPGSPGTGDIYLAGIGSAGAWIGEDNDIQEWNGSIWVNTTPTIGQLLVNAANDAVYKFTAGGWIALALPLHHLGDNYGPINIFAGNKRNKSFYIKTFNINRARWDSIGRFYNYLTPPGTAGTDSIIVKQTSTGMFKAISPTYYGTGTTTNPTGNYGNVQINRNSVFSTPASDSLSFNSASLNVIGAASISKNALANSYATALTLINNTAATGATAPGQQWSPGVLYSGYGWATTGGVSQQVGIRNYGVPTTGGTAGMTMNWDFERAGVSITSPVMSLTNAGILTTGQFFANTIVTTPIIQSNGANTTLTVQNSGATGSGGSTIRSLSLFAATNSMTNGDFVAVSVNPTHNQSGSTTPNTDFRIQRLETSLSSGAQYLFEAGTRSGAAITTAFTQKFAIDNLGNTIQTGNETIAVGKGIIITEGTDGRLGQTTLVSGTKAITINGLTTSSRAFVQLVTRAGTSTAVYEYTAVCTANTLTITAITVTGTTVATDTSVLNYIVYN